MENETLESALSVLIAAANEGDTSAQYELGERYRTGDGIEKDRKRASSWYEVAARNGNANAAYRLGVGRLSKSKNALGQYNAVGWLKLAAEARHTEAQLCLGWCYQRGIGVEDSSGRVS